MRNKLLRNILPPSNPTRGTYKKFGSTQPQNKSSGNNKYKSVTLEVSNKVTPPTALSHPAQDEDIEIQCSARHEESSCEYLCI